MPGQIVELNPPIKKPADLFAGFFLGFQCLMRCTPQTTISPVIPAKAGIQLGSDVVYSSQTGLDSRFRGNDWSVGLG